MRAAMPPRNASWSARRISSRMRRFSEASRMTSTCAVAARPQSRRWAVTSRRSACPLAVTTGTSLSCTGPGAPGSPSRSRANRSLPLCRGNAPASERMGSPRWGSSDRSSRASAVALNDTRVPDGSRSSMPSGSRARMSLSRTKRSMDSVSRPTAASSAPSSSRTLVVFLGWSPCSSPICGENASAFSTMPRMRPARLRPTIRPPTAASPPATAAPVKRRIFSWSACGPLSSLAKGRAR